MYPGVLFSCVNLQSLVLRDYEDILPVVDIYSLLALTSSASNTFRVCSKVKNYTIVENVVQVLFLFHFYIGIH